MRPRQVCPLRTLGLITSLLLLSSATSVTLGQTIPSVPGLQLQLTANAGTSSTVDGAEVADWIDQEHSHFFFNANDAIPTYVADSGGGIPALDFTRSSGYLGDFSDSAGGTIGDATIFVVARFDGYEHVPGSSSYFFSIDNFADPGLPNVSEHTLGRDADGFGPDALYHWRGQPAPAAAYGTNIVEDNAGAPFGDFNYYTAIYRATDDGGGSVNEMEAWINGSDGGALTPDLTHNGSGYLGLPSETRIGLWTNSGSGLDGMIREVLIYNRVLNSTEIGAVETYLAERAAAPVAPTLLMQIDRDTGVATLKNVSGGNLEISGYQVTSDGGTISRDNWTSIAANYDADNDQSVDASNTWQESGAATDDSLEEAASAGFATLSDDQEIMLGTVWTQFHREDVLLQFNDSAGSPVFAQVQFSGNGDALFEFGDLDFSGSIGIEDWTQLLQVYGSDLANTTEAEAYGLGDLTGDGAHTLEDIQAFRQAFVDAGNSLSLLEGAGLPVPEPASSLIVAALAAPWLALRRRRSISMPRTRGLASIVVLGAVVSLAAPTYGMGLFDEIGSLSGDAQSKLLVHFDGGIGVTTDGGGAVTSWEGRDGDGNLVATALAAGTGGPGNIVHSGSSIVFNETNTNDTLHLSAPLTHAANGNWTIFWYGHFDSSNQNGAEDAGTYAYNLTDLGGQSSGFNQQRDNGQGAFVSEIYTGGDGDAGAATSVYGLSDQFDDANTVWRNTHTDDGNDGFSSSLHANSSLIGQVASGRTLPANSTLLLGAFDDGTRFNSSGYTHLGEIEQFLVFDGILGANDVAVIEDYLGPELPTVSVDTGTGQMFLEGGDTTVPFNAYEITSDAGSLDGVAWEATNLDARNVDAIGPGVGQSWDTFSATSQNLTESILLSSSTFDDIELVSGGYLGDGYDTAVDARDLVFRYTLTDGSTRTGVIEYVASPAVEGDYNGDGTVDAIDYAVWRESLGATGSDLAADGDGNGSVGSEDYTYWKVRFGNTGPGPSAVESASIPEPGTASLCLLFATLTLALGRRK